MKTFASLALAAVLLLPASAIAQGSLTPPGAPAPMMKTLDEIDAKLEKRTPITSLPFTINAPGSYYLAGSLGAIFGGDGITITADDVTLDLNGFSLYVSPIASGTLNGVYVPGAQKNLLIRNGTIRGWGASGINSIGAFGALNCQFENLRLSNNGAAGLYAVNSAVRNCVAISNTVGFNLQSSSVTGCNAANNTGAGFLVTDSSLHESSANSNATGVSASQSTVSGCSVSYNSSTGISTQYGTVSGCTAYGNHVGITAGGSTVSGCTVNTNDGNGITAQGGCMILNNTCNYNGNLMIASGIAGTGGGNRIEGNTVAATQHFGNGVAVAGGGNLIIRNSATANATNFSGITATDSAGPIVTSTTIGTNNNPNANFAF
jgi:hypothetical protein